MTSHHSYAPSRLPGQQCGFSLIELMIAITLGLLILAGMLTVFVNTSATRNEIDRANRQIENGRYAMDLLRDDIQLAGFFGEIDMGLVEATTPTMNLPGTLPDPCGTTLVERTDPAGADKVSGVIRLHVQGVNNYVAGALPCLTGPNAVKLGTDVIVVRRVKTCFAGVGDCDSLAALNGKPALQVSLCAKPTPAQVSASLIKTHALAIYPNAGEFKHLLNYPPGSPAGTDCSVAAPLRPYVIYLYFVGTDDVLKRAEFVNGVGMGNVTSLVDGIENLQFDYGVDTTLPVPDGTADIYTASPATVDAWSNVVSVQINLLARNTESSPGYTDTKTYNLGPSASPFVPNSAILIGPKSEPETSFRRHVFSARVRIQNLSGRRERP
jgi:type IV pilus assembly protein PilW